MSVKEFPICPRCEKPVIYEHDRHELHLQLVNAYDGAPKDHVDLQAAFHHDCAAAVWNVATAAWRGKDV